MSFSLKNTRARTQIADANLDAALTVKMIPTLE